MRSCNIKYESFLIYMDQMETLKSKLARTRYNYEIYKLLRNRRRNYIGAEFYTQS